MFSNTQLEQYFEDKNLPQSARELIQHLRSVNPARAVQSSGINNTARFASAKMGRTIQAESLHGELAQIWLWEFDDDTYEFWDQVPQVKLNTVNTNGRSGGHLVTIDFFILQKHFTGWVEVKSRDFIEKKVNEGDRNYYRDETAGWRYRPGEEYAKQFRLDYRVQVLENINQNLVLNTQFLAAFRQPECPAVPDDQAELIRSAVLAQGWIRLIDLVRRAPPVNADHVYKLIAERQLYVRLGEERLCEMERTLVYPDAAGAESHRQVAELDVRGTPALEVQRVDLIPGSRVVWDGRIWSILNAGSANYSLQDEESRIIEMKREQLHQLVTTNRIVAAVSNSTAAAERARVRLERASPLERDAAVRRLRAIFPRSGDAPCSTPARTLRFWRRSYRLGQDKYGNGYIGLLPNYGQQGNRNRKLSQAALTTIRDMIQQEHSQRPTQWPKLTPLLGKVNSKLRAGHQPTISEKTLSRELKRGYSPDKITEIAAGAKAAYGERAMYWRIDADTPRHGQHPFDIGHIDNTQLDLQLFDERFVRRTRKCWATAIIDGYDREILAVFICFAAPSAASAMAAIRLCLQRHGRVSKTLIFDHGREFSSAAFERLLARLEVNGLKRPPSSPKHGALVERLFKRWNQDVLHNLLGSNVPLQSPRSMSATHDPRRTTLWSFERFEPEFTKYLYDVYPNMIHSALGVSPREAREQGLRDFGERLHQCVSYDESVEMLCHPYVESETLTVQKGGRLKYNNIIYQHLLLNNTELVGQRVPAHFDAFNASRLFVFVKNKWVTVTSPLESTFARYTQAEVRRVSARIRELATHGREFRLVNAEKLAAYLMAIEAEDVKVAARKLVDKKATSQVFEATVKTLQDLHDNLFRYIIDDRIPEPAHRTSVKADEATAHQPDNTSPPQVLLNRFLPHFPNAAGAAQ